MTKPVDPTEELLSLVEKSPPLFADKMQTLAEAIIKRKDTEDAENDLARLIGNTMALADLMGRKRVLMETDAAKHGIKLRLFDPDLACYRFYSTPAVAVEPVVFERAFDDIMSREPRLAESAEEVKRAYMTGGFAVARLPKYLSTEARLRLTERIQGQISSYVKKGERLPEVREQLADIGNFSAAYAENVYRTNLATAYTAGRFKEMQDPEVREIAPCLQFSAVRDGNTRPNHWAAHGTIAPIDHAVWDVLSPPLGYQCRCTCNVVTIYELRDRGLMERGQPKSFFPVTFRNAHADPGFKVSRTDRRIYG